MAGLLDQVIGLLDDPKKRMALEAMLGAIPQKQQNVSRGIRKAIGDSVAFPREYMNTYQPGSMASDNPAATDWAAGMAMNMVGAPMMTGGVPSGALGSAARNPLYHGSSQRELQMLTPSERGPLGPGVYTSEAEQIAKSYAGDTGRVYELPAKERDIYRGTGHKTD
jgi:hypothetical protein